MPKVQIIVELLQHYTNVHLFQIMDEADRILNMDFEEEVSIRNFLCYILVEKQTQNNLNDTF